MSDFSPQVGRTGHGQGGAESPMVVTRTRSGDNMVRPQPVTEQSLMESVAGIKILMFWNCKIFCSSYIICCVKINDHCIINTGVEFSSLASR